jgi:hypothetical protein
MVLSERCSLAVNGSNVISLMHYKGNFEHHCQVGSPEETIGDTPLADIKNEVAKQFVLRCGLQD